MGGFKSFLFSPEKFVGEHFFQMGGLKSPTRGEWIFSEETHRHTIKTTSSAEDFLEKFRE